jgi:hypothetical protein
MLGHVVIAFERAGEELEGAGARPERSAPARTRHAQGLRHLIAQRIVSSVPNKDLYSPRELLEMKFNGDAAPTVYHPTFKSLAAMAYGDYFPGPRAAYAYFNELPHDARERLIVLLLARGRIARVNLDDTFTSVAIIRM